MDYLGNPVQIRDVSGADKAAWNTIMGAFRIKPSEGEGESVSPSLVQLSRIATLRAAALKLSGLPPDSKPALGAVAPVSSAGTAPEAPPNKKIKLSSLVPMSGTDFRGLFSDYQKSRG